MDMRCVKFRNNIPDMDEFKTAAQPLLDWVNKNCNPHEIVVVKMGRVTLMCDEMGFTAEIPD